MTSASGEGPSPQPIEDRAAATFQLVHTWMFSDAMAQLLDAFGERLPAPDLPWAPGDPAANWLHLNEDLPDWLDAVVAGSGDRQLSDDMLDVLRRVLTIERLAADHFNFRTRDGGKYKERSQAVTAGFGDELRSLIHTQANDLGLVTPQAARFDSYDRTLVLGGGYRSPLLRTRYATLIQTQGVDLGAVYLLGSPRPLIAEPPEQPTIELYAPGAVDEFDLMTAAGCVEFDLAAADIQFLCGCTPDVVSCPRWKARNSPNADETPPVFTHERSRVLADTAGRPGATVLSASTGRPPYRPDTSDTFDLWARVARPRHGERILVVTTQVFVPFQTFDGIRRLHLPLGVEIDAVGFGADWGDRPETAEYLLQEVLSAIRSARRLLVDAAAILTSAAKP